ncbi:glycosyltransferase family A protein [Paenibacillus sp. FSL R7-0048]|uniref:glycosyltransferase family 2 protein n=1 Tax=Paenibacillus TaxID=44249 RepID=UPI0009D73AFB|nr:glycosyltransferase family A protein [Paenibacillus odorifer]
MSNPMITVVTPTYNRAYTLENSYNSLRKQTCKSFIWMIIDDGSKDETESLVGEWIKQETDFKIIYLKKENGGKASALNLSFNRVYTDYYVCLDSDDTFTSNAIDIAIKRLDEIKYDKKYCGILALRTKPNGQVLGGKQIPSEVKDITLSDLTNKYEIKSELICFYKTHMVMKYRFPEIDGEKFISPAYLEHRIGKDYKYLASRESYCICEYLPDGLTRNKIEVIIKNPKGYTLVIREAFEVSTNFIIKSKHCVMYIAGCILSGDKECIRNSPNKKMTTLYYPLGWIAYKIRFGAIASKIQ